MKRCRLSSGGGASIPSSAVVPNAPPACDVSQKSTGGSQTYGPSIFTPAFGFDQVATLSRVGFCQCREASVDFHCASTAAPGGLSLPYVHTIALGCARSVRIWLARDALATDVCSAVQLR